MSTIVFKTNYTNNTNTPFIKKYSMGECQICYTRGLIIPCKICEEKACKTCIRKFIMDNNTNESKCMYCSSTYNWGTLIDMLGKTFINGEYTKHFNEVIVKSHTQNLHNFQKKVNDQIERTRLEKELKSLTTQMKEIKEKIRDVKHQLSHIDSDIKDVTKRPCSDKNCNGYLDLNWTCVSCSTETCSKCLEIKEFEHVCDENVINTIKLLNKDTKSCPRCSFAISKIDGCDQMFCTSCHTAFSWKTGLVDESRIHNPHYYEYLRSIRTSSNDDIPREEGQCGGDIILARNIDISNILRKLNVILIHANTKYDNDKIVIENYENIIYSMNFIELYILDIIFYIENINSWKMSDLSVIANANGKIEKNSIDFIMNNIDKKKYEKSIILYNHKKILANEILLLNTMLYNVVIEMFIEFYEKAEIETMIFSLDEIFANNEDDITIFSLDNNEFEKQSIKYIKTTMKYNNKALDFVETLKNNIASIVQYYNEEITNLKTIYNNKNETYINYIVEQNNQFLNRLLTTFP